MLIALVPARISSECDRMTERLSLMRFEGECSRLDEVELRVSSIENGVRNLNFGQGLGFMLFGLVIDKRSMKTLGTGMGMGLSSVLTLLVAIGETAAGSGSREPSGGGPSGACVLSEEHAEGLWSSAALLGLNGELPTLRVRRETLTETLHCFARRHGLRLQCEHRQRRAPPAVLTASTVSGNGEVEVAHRSTEPSLGQDARVRPPRASPRARRVGLASHLLLRESHCPAARPSSDPAASSCGPRPRGSRRQAQRSRQARVVQILRV